MEEELFPLNHQRVIVEYPIKHGSFINVTGILLMQGENEWIVVSQDEQCHAVFTAKQVERVIQVHSEGNKPHPYIQLRDNT